MTATGSSKTQTHSLTSTSLSDVERPCQFCKAKCKTVTDGVPMCADCRSFAHKSLVKHHMFVCKGQEAQQLSGVDEDTTDRCNEPSKIKQVPQDLLCRYCFFKQIVLKLPSLNRLQKYMIEFINRRLMFVNSVSQKSMLWKNRIASTRTYLLSISVELDHSLTTRYYLQ